MTLDLAAMEERAEKWRDFTPLAKEDFAEEFADDLAAYVLALVEEVRQTKKYGAGLRCPTCGLIVVFTWGEKGAAPEDEPLCSPIRCPDCWVDGKSSLFSREPAEEAT